MLDLKLCPWLFDSLAQLEAARAGERLGHGWLLHGSAGIGKTNLALVFARRLLDGTADQSPAQLSAEEFLSGMQHRHESKNHHPDLHWLYPEDGRSTIGVEQVREVCSALELHSYSGSAKVVIIEPAEALTTSAANALLKTLEEPTSGSFLLLVSHRAGLLPATVRSRCQQLRLQPPTAAVLQNWLPEADTAQRLALTPLEWLGEHAEGEGTAASQQRAGQLASVIAERGNPLEVADEWAKGDADHILAWLIRTLHSLIRRRFIENASKLVTESGDTSLHNAASALSLRTLFNRLEEAQRLRGELAGGINVQLAMRALLLEFVPHKGMT